MAPACVKLTILVFIAYFAMRAKSQTQQSIGASTSETDERCVCQPHITVNPPVYRRSANQTASSEIQGLKRQLEELQDAVSTLVKVIYGKFIILFFDNVRLIS